jgi:hypothetical protein
MACFGHPSDSHITTATTNSIGVRNPFIMVPPRALNVFLHVQQR